MLGVPHQAIVIAMPHAAPNTFAFISLSLVLASGTVNADHITFAAPVSGAKVSHYQADLSLPRDQRQSFSVPADCGAVLASQTRGNARWGDPIEQRLWNKVTNDCRYYAFLHSHPAAANDFVSDVDFRNARIDQLPFPEACAQLSDCPAIPSGVAYVANMFAAITVPPAFPPPRSAPNLVNNPSRQQASQQCRFVDGLFRGHIHHDPAGRPAWRCQVDPNAPGFRLLSIDYGDVNGDGYQDAVLRLVPLGNGLSRSPRILPITRLEAGGPFILPP